MSPRRLIQFALVALVLVISTNGAGEGALRGRFFVPTTGYIDPTVAAFNGSKPLVHCASSCTTALINQNTDALQAALDQAATGTHPWVHIPPGQYPIARGAVLNGSHTAIYGVLITGKSRIVVVGYGATIRESGALTGTYEMMQVANSSDIRLYGLTWSQRDDSTPVEQNHMIQLGTGTNSTNGTVDNVQIVDSRFEDGKGGDPIRFLGGSDLNHLVTRIAVHSNVINGKRTALSFQHGTAFVSAVGNYMGPDCTDQLIDHEPTSNGGNNFFNAIGNVLDRNAGVNFPLVTFGGNSAGEALDSTATSTVFAENYLANGDIFYIDTRHVWIVGNVIRSSALHAKGTITLTRMAENNWIVDNKMSQNTGDDSTGIQQINAENNSGDYPTNIWIRDNTIDMFDVGGSAMYLNAKDTWIVGNTITNHNASTAYNGIILRGDGNSDLGVPLRVSGYISNNMVRKAPGAGNVAIGYSCGNSSISVSGFCRMRDNVLKDAATFMQSTTVTVPEGYPLVSGNQLVSVTSTGLNSNKWTTDTTVALEVITSGDLSAAIRAARVAGNCGTQNIALPDGLRDGAMKVLESPKGVCTTTTTITPAHFGDGTSLSWTSTTSSLPVFVTLAWDAVGSKWWTIETSSNVTVNP